MVLFPTDESNANLHYILKRDPPHFFIYHYPWFMNNAWIKKSWIDSLESEKTPYVLYFPKSWDIEEYAPELIAYLNQNYSIIDNIEWHGTRIQIMQRKFNASPLAYQ